jgi:competence protein ComFC
MCGRHFGAGGYMVTIHPARIPGRWSDGRALDVHTVSSTYLGDDEFGRPSFDTTRSPVGELLYRLKYKGDQGVVAEIAEVAAAFVREWQPAVDLVVPVPPSRDRTAQPVLLVGAELASRLAVRFCPECVRRTRTVPQLKDVFDYDERWRLLEGLHEVSAEAVRGKRVLLFDDLFRSGATMNAITAVMFDSAGATAVYALTLTRTRSAH